MDLSEHSDADLLSGVATLVRSHRDLTARLVAHLAEIEERRLHLSAGFSSMFDFCTGKLGFSEGEAFRRILAARLARRFPIVYSLLASGRANLSTLEFLRERLTEENHRELFAAVAGKGKRDVQMILAARFPEPKPPSKIRRQANIEPVSELWFKVQFTASDELRQKLELCRDLMSHANPSRDLASVIERAVDLLLADLERKRLGKTRRPSTLATSGKRNPSRVRTAARREVFERDGLRCTFLSEDGRRCGARAFLELDHVDAKANGGSNEAKNLRVLCRAHNQLAAEQTFGREHIERRRLSRQNAAAHHGDGHLREGLPSTRGHLRQQKSTSTASDPWAEQETTTATILEKVRSALRSMGFRDAQARRAIAAVAGRHDPGEALDLTRTLRAAILVATAA
jgi:5-methylcytosine-specific restriction endonuclease McrA